MADLSSNPDNLIPFLELVAANQKANIANFPDPYQLIRRVNICFSKAGKNLINPKPVLAGLMLPRCEYAYKTAAGMALSGQVAEAFVMMRSWSPSRFSTSCLCYGPLNSGVLVTYRR
jgi:hypothetical protein